MATAGPDAFRLTTALPLHVEDGTVTAEFVAGEGAREQLTLTWHVRSPAGRAPTRRAHGGVVAGVERTLPVEGRIAMRC